MALDLTKLTAYVEEKRLPILRNAVIGNRSASEFSLMTGVKGATALNLLNTTVTFGDGTTCGWNEAGKSELSQRVLTPGVIKVNMSFCDKAMLKYWMNYDVRVAAGQKTLPFEEDFINGVVENIKAELEKAMWQGDTDSSTNNLKYFDGMIKILNAATLGGTYTVASGDSMSKIIMETYNLIPAKVFEKGEVVMYVGTDGYRKYIQELIANGNYVVSGGLQDVSMPQSILIPGTNVRIIPVAGLDNQKMKALATYKDNLIVGVDMAGDEDTVDFWYSQDAQEHRLAISFLMGVQTAFPDCCVIAQEA